MNLRQPRRMGEQVNKTQVCKSADSTCEQGAQGAHASSPHGIPTAACDPQNRWPHLSHRPSSFRNWLRTEPTRADSKPCRSSGTAAAAAAAAAGVAPAPAAGGGTTPLRATVRCGRGCCAGSGGTPCSPLPSRPAAGVWDRGWAEQLWRRTCRRRRRRWSPHLPRHPLLPGSRLHMQPGTHCSAAPARRAGRCGATGARSGAGAARPSAGLQRHGRMMPRFAASPCSQTGRACNMRAPPLRQALPLTCRRCWPCWRTSTSHWHKPRSPPWAPLQPPSAERAGKWWEAKLGANGLHNVVFVNWRGA